jgi:adenylate cyclase
MSEGGESRRLSAVLMADIAGYTRLVERDTDGTVSAWKAARADIIDPTVAAFSGRIVKLTGDGFLAEFSTVQDAVACAIAMQKALFDSPLSFRMGVSLGDIVADGQDIHGEGVNIAARIEAFAPKGGICVSGVVHDQVRNRLDVDFKDLGDIPVKNVSQPVRVYAVLGIGMVEQMVLPDTARKRVFPAVVGAIAIVLMAAGGGYWLLQEKTTTATASAPQQDKAPSIAILPFVNLSDNPARAYFANGMTEDITTDLSRVEGLSVTAPSATLRYLGKGLDPAGMGSALNVSYILEGSVRQAGDQIRITAKLIDTTTGAQRWAERFDRSNADVFAIQDEISKRVVEHLSAALGGNRFCARDAAIPRMLPPMTFTFRRARNGYRRLHRTSPRRSNLLNGRSIWTLNFLAAIRRPHLCTSSILVTTEMAQLPQRRT